MSVLAVHGIRNYQGAYTSDVAAGRLANLWQPALASGYQAAGLSAETVPVLHAAYYADLLMYPEEQGAADDIASLDAQEAEIAWAWALAVGLPEPVEAQGLATAPLRQALDWIAQRHRLSIHKLARTVVAFAREANRYLTHTTAREAARASVAASIRRYRPKVLIAHSLGSVVAYETLCANPDLSIERFITLGSPLGLPGGVFERLAPEPENGLGTRPPGVGTWFNSADYGDIVAVPRFLGHRFPVDRHAEYSIGALDFHTMKAYLASGPTAETIAEASG